MIVTLTMNPALDKSTSVDLLIAERKLRCESMITEAGGGGINVSKAIHELGGESLAIFPSGGDNGKKLERILKEKGVSYISIPVLSETREDFSVIETDTNAQFRFVMPGCVLKDNEVANILSVISGMDPFPDFIIASGSLPRGVPDNFYGMVAAICNTRGVKFILDTSGKPLPLATTEGIYLLKPNLAELCSLSDAKYLQLHEIDDAAKEIIKKGYCQVVVVSLGPAGAMLVTKDEKINIAAPNVKKHSTVGAGDSMVGGMVWMLQQGGSLNEMLQFGVACGTAATMNPGTRLFKKQDAFKLYEWLKNHNK